MRRTLAVVVLSVWVGLTLGADKKAPPKPPVPSKHLKVGAKKPLPKHVADHKPAVHHKNPPKHGKPLDHHAHPQWVRHPKEPYYYNHHYYKNHDYYQKVFKNYVETYAVKAEYGYYYQGHNHYHWAYYFFAPAFGTYLHYDPFLRTYFYWCAKDGRYYPIGYVPYGRYF